ncbi:MAG: hypothetical protein KF730_15575 [Sphingomonas sp.]|uniref:hypothetical protein n=1 Tax=Sphingomonas sp. TaxID=28214 RepID=UPI0025FC9F16|nr:hypothetical protein [Sphingomonas sp.]MBX3565985.1 hypothetical protein [Sphingomonas sp.]
MSTGAALALLGICACIAWGAHIMLRPQIYLGKGTAPVTDPRVIRGFGAFLIVLGVSIAVLNLTQFVSE